MKDPEFEQKAKALTSLQRNEMFTEISPVHKTQKIANENFLKSLDMLTAARNEKLENLNKIEASDVIDFNETGELTVNTSSTKSSLSTILYHLQQPN